MSVSSVLRSNNERFRSSVLRQLFEKQPHTRLWFPAHEADAHENLVFALCYLLDHDVDPQLVTTLARDHIKVGLTATEVEVFFPILSREIHALCADLSHEEVTRADRRLQDFAQLMISALRDAKPAPVARVVEVQRRSRRITVVRLISEPFDFLPGQFVSVSSNLTRGYWRNLCPAMPPADGMLEFHIFDEDDVLHALAMSQPDDEWTIGVPHGDLHISGDNDVLMLAHATGLAPMRALILELMRRPHQPRVHMFYGAEYPGELYDLRGLWNLASVSPWLSVTPVVGTDSDPWWVKPSEHSQAPRGLHLQEVAELADAATKWGTWSDRDVLIAGPGDMVHNTVAALVANGTPAENIQYLPYS